MKSDIHITSDIKLMDVDVIYRFLTRSYWAKGRSRKDVLRSMQHSYCFALLKGKSTIGFARVVSDEVVFAYIMDLFIRPVFRGKGYSKMLMDFMINSPKLAGVQKWMLATKDTQDLYRKFNFEVMEDPRKYMQMNKKKKN